jgi:hypothetical protein
MGFRQQSPPSGPSAAGAADVSGSTGAAVERILSGAEEAVEAIADRTHQQVRELAAGVELKTAEEVHARRLRLEGVRAELAVRAADLATAYGATIVQMAEIDAALAAPVGAPPRAVPDGAAGVDPRVAAIRMTLRERRRIGIAVEPGQPDPAAVAAPPVAVSVPPPAPPPVAPPAAEPEQPTVVEFPRRRWWRLWDRAAA